MAFEDKVITCVECGTEFDFSASEQEFYAEKGFTNAPRRCQPCRRQRRQGGGGAPSGGGGRGGRELFTATCAGCGKEASVPFRPTGARPVYCDDCFRSRR